MSIALLFQGKDPLPWQFELRRKFAAAQVRPIPEVEIYPDIADKSQVKMLICWNPPVQFWQEFPKLELIQSVGAGVDHILNAGKLPIHLKVHRIADEYLGHDMFEFAFAMVLQQIRRIPAYRQQQHLHQWQQLPYRRLKDISITVLGLGKIGQVLAINFAQLGMQVRGWSRTPKFLAGVKCYHSTDGLADALRGSDFLINVLPLTPATKGILNQSNMSLLAEGAYLIQVGRGAHLVEADLIDLLDKSKLSGATLDVFTTEPLPKDHAFWSHPKIQVIPHASSLSDLNSVSTQIVQHYIKWASGTPLPNLIDPILGY